MGRGTTTTQPLEQWQTSGEARVTGLQAGHEPAAAGREAQRARGSFRGWKMAQQCKKPRNLSWRLSRLGVLAGCCHLMAAGRAAKMVLGNDWHYFSPTVQQPQTDPSSVSPRLRAPLGDLLLICIGGLSKAGDRPVMEHQLESPCTKPRWPFGGSIRCWLLQDRPLGSLKPHQIQRKFKT